MSRRSRGFTLAALPLTLALALTGCAGEGSDNLAQQWADGSDKGFIAGDGTTTSIAPEARTQAVIFAGVGERDEPITSADFAGVVTVVNFWYAGCAPCRAEAADLAEVDLEFDDADVRFLGVNTRDQSAQALQFAEEFNIKYPSIMDSVGDRAVQRAFAGQIPLNAVPTTLVLDRKGRVAHRIVGQIADPSQLRTLVNETLAEGPA
jgi:peroxiredoxin